MLRALHFKLVRLLAFREIRMRLDHVRILVAELECELADRPLQLEHPVLGGNHGGILGDDCHVLERLAHRVVLDLVVGQFALLPPALGRHRVVVQLVQPRADEILLVVQRQRVLALAILRHRAIAVLHFLQLLDELLVEPIDHVLRAAELDLEVRVDVLVDERVRGCRCELRVRRLEGDFDELAARDWTDVDP